LSENPNDTINAAALVATLAQSCGASPESIRGDIEALAAHLREIAEKVNRTGCATALGLSSVFGAPMARTLADLLIQAIAPARG
jgi:hypothetical protein